MNREGNFKQRLQVQFLYFSVNMFIITKITSQKVPAGPTYLWNLWNVLQNLALIWSKFDIALTLLFTYQDLVGLSVNKQLHVHLKRFLKLRNIVFGWNMMSQELLTWDLKLPHDPCSFIKSNKEELKGKKYEVWKIDWIP